MELRWTDNAEEHYNDALEYWYKHNKSFDYSKKIALEALKIEKSIIEKPYSSSQYSETLNLHKKSFFKGKFSLFYQIDEEENVIWIIDFRSNRQKPLF
jgi:hypothetical protein